MPSSSPLSLLSLPIYLLLYLTSTTLAVTYIDDASPLVTYQGVNVTNYNANVAGADITDLGFSYNSTYSGIGPGASVAIPFTGTGIAIFGLEAAWQASWGRNITFSLDPPANPSSPSSPSTVILPPSHNAVQLYNASIYAVNGLPSADYTLTMAVHPYNTDANFESFYWDYAEVVSLADQQAGVVVSTSVYVVSGASTPTSTGTAATSVGVGNPLLTTFSGQPTSSASAAAAKKSTSIGPIIGGVIGGLAILILFIFAALLLWRRSKREQALITNQMDVDVEPKPFHDFGMGMMGGGNPGSGGMGMGMAGTENSQTTLGQVYAYSAVPIMPSRAPKSASSATSQPISGRPASSVNPPSSAAGSSSAGFAGVGILSTTGTLAQHQQSAGGSAHHSGSQTSPEPERPLTSAQRAHLHALVAQGAPPAEIARAVESMQQGSSSSARGREDEYQYQDDGEREEREEEEEDGGDGAWTEYDDMGGVLPSDAPPVYEEAARAGGRGGRSVRGGSSVGRRSVRGSVRGGSSVGGRERKSARG